MLERLIENWLINTGERGYEVAFAQLLAAEEHRVLQGPVHHPFEHGKDILTFAPDGQLHAYQLKGPNVLNIESFEEIQGQLLALVGAAVTHPAVSPARRADRVFLVTNASLTPPVRDRIEKFNLGNLPAGLPPIEPVEREQLLGRFIAAHGKYLPQTLPDIRNLLELYYSDPASLFPVRRFAAYLNAILPFPPQVVTMPDCRKAVANVTLLTAYAVASWTRADNHLCVAQAWLTVCLTLLRFAAFRGLDESVWVGSYELSLEAARAAIASLSREAAEAPDVAVPDLVEGLVYPSRALIVGGLLAAYFLSERTIGFVDRAGQDHIRTVLKREVPHMVIVGESDVPAIFVVALALEQIGEIKMARQLMVSLVANLSKLNQRHSKSPFPDPYHDAEEVLLSKLGADSDLEGEGFDGRSYMLHIGVEWLARRLWRQHLATFWSSITRVQFLEFQPSTPDNYLAVEDNDGELRMWFAGQPQSWAVLVAQSTDLDKALLPQLLWSRRELMPYLPILFPHRLTATLAKAVDAIASDPKA